MAKEAASWTQRIGGNRTLVLGVMILLLVLFTVDIYVGQALGVGNRGGGFIKFTVNGREVVIDQGRYQATMSDWQRFQQGLAMMTRQPRGGDEEFKKDLMLAEIARDAGLAVPDATLREFIRILPLFADASGEFDAKTFEEALKSVFGGLRPRVFEEQARLLLLVTQYRTLCEQSYYVVDDDEAYRKWKGDFPKIGVVYTWAATSTLRAAMKPEDLKPEEVESYWKNPSVQDRHRLKPRYLFEAAAVTVDEVDGQAYLDARAASKDDPDLQLKKDQNTDDGFDFFLAGRNNDFDITVQTAETVDALRAENAAAVEAEDAPLKKSGADVPLDPNATAPPVDLSRMPADKLDDREAYRRLWRFRIEKELWLKKLLGKVRKAASEGKEPLAQVAERFSRPGIRIRVLEQDQPVDQYGVEFIKGFGAPNCELRYELNGKKSEDEGKVHDQVLGLTANRDRLKERGWLVFRLNKVLPEEVPPLETVKEKVASELLDERARDRARADLEGLRKAAEDARKPLEEIAREKGLETATAGPFNAYSWRPPTPKPAAGAPAPVEASALQEGWKDPARRLTAVMGRYSALRYTPVGNFGPVLEDFSGSGAYYLAQVKTSEEPTFQEMNQAQLRQFKRVLAGERRGIVDRELSYGGLKNRCGLTINGEPAPEPEAERRRR